MTQLTKSVEGGAAVVNPHRPLNQADLDAVEQPIAARSLPRHPIAEALGVILFVLFAMTAAAVFAGA